MNRLDLLLVAGCGVFLLGVGLAAVSSAMVTHETNRVDEAMRDFECETPLSDIEAPENQSIHTETVVAEESCQEQMADRRQDLTRENWLRGARYVSIAGGVFRVAGLLFVPIALWGKYRQR